MKITDFCLLLCFCLIKGTLYAQNLTGAESDLVAAFKKIDYWADKKNTNARYDSLEKATERFGELLKTYAEKYPETIAEPFDNLTASGVKIVTSADGRLRIYSWDTKLGENVKKISHITQYKSHQKNGVYLSQTHYYSEYSNGDYYTNINELSINAHTYYLTFFETQFSSTFVIQGLQVMSISDDNLQDITEIIEDGQRRTGMLITGFRQKTIERLGRKTFISYNANSKTITVPLTDHKFEAIARIDVYKFNGQYFEKVK